VSQRILVGTNKGLFTIAKGGKGWEISGAAHVGVPVPIAAHDPRDGSLYAVLDHGHFGVKLQRSTDKGETWKEIACPAYPEMPEGKKELNGMGQPWEWKLKGVWSLVPGHASQPGQLWCGTAPGGLFKSTDHGATWTLVRGLWDHPERVRWFGGGTLHPALHSICVDPRDGNHVYVAISCGGVWETTDNGETWKVRGKGMWADFLPPEEKGDEVLQDPHLLTMCPSAPESLWVQHHCGIFRSTDGAKNWSEVTSIKPSTFGFAVAVHPKDPNTAWFVPGKKDDMRIAPEGKVVVTRTRDGGKTNDILREGLPQNHAYDLVYRHALDIDKSGDVLAFGSTTGNLWVTENQGDRWQNVSTFLPPIKCVRFA
jgi:hypothetical protein